MKIVHIGNTLIPTRLAYGGAVERRIVELARAQAKQGEEVVVFSAEKAESRWTEDSVSYEAIPVGLPRPYRDYEFLLASRKRLAKSRADIVHVHNIPDGGRLARNLSIPAVLTFDYFRYRATRWRIGRMYYRRSLATYSHLLPVSAACDREFAQFWRHSPTPTTVLYNGANLGQFCPNPNLGLALKSKLGLTRRPVVLYVGRLCEQKGVNTLLDAWPMVQKSQPEAALLVAGPVERFGNSGRDSPLVQKLQALGGVYLGAVSDADLNSVFNACDIFVMPTRRDEMFGMAALEAQACGKPVVASRCGGLRESVGEDSGVFFTPGDARELSSVLRGLIESPQQRMRMGEAAIVHARQFSWQRIANQSLEIYRSVLTGCDSSIIPRSAT
jgi:glycosyltransferase involved in cell wall biosynthesis